MGQFSLKLSGLPGSHLSGNQHAADWIDLGRVVSEIQAAGGIEVSLLPAV